MRLHMDAFLMIIRSAYNKLWRLFNGIKVVLLKKYLPYEYAKLYYKARTGKTLDYNKPIDFNEKLFWLERYYKDPLVIKATDKYFVRDYVRGKGWGSILIELHGIYLSPEEIEFDALPEKFVLKCTHGCGFNIFCSNKISFDKDDAKRRLRYWMGIRYGRDSAEFHYEKIEPRIIAERYIEQPSGSIKEVQIFCINGKPEFILARNDLGYSTGSENSVALSYTLDWQRVAYRKNEESIMHVHLERPYKLDEMLACASDLAKPFPQVRVDFYNLGDRFLLGELTFSTSGNILSNYKVELIESLGKKLLLPI